MNIVAVLLDIACTFNEIFWLYQLVNVFLKNKEGFISKKLINWIVYVTYIVVVISMNRIELTSAYTMVFVMFLNLVFVLSFWKCDFTQAIAVVGGYFFSMFLEGNIVISITGAIGGEELIQKCTGEQGTIRVIYLLFNGVIWYILNKCMISIMKKKVIYSQGLGYVAGISVLGFIGSAFIGTMLVNSFNTQVGMTWYVFLAIILLIVFGCYFVMKQKEARLRMEVLNATNEMLEKNYVQVNEFYSANAKLYHDMNHHFDAVYHMLQQGEVQGAQKYIEGLRSTNSYASIRSRSGINVLDAVLFEAEQKAERKGVTFTIEVPVLPSNLKIENSDICSLFANLLQNALEAANKGIYLKVKKVQQTLLINIQNDYLMEPIKQGSHFITQKTEKSIHGWGTQIVEEIVSKYDGNIEYFIEEKIFRVEIIIYEKEN